ncbi:hypothetical protein MHBO_004406 [Bonamia ostreae]|uniref:U3 small nucleolar RNA-associated protein 13 C-terminal domain-containing protein n=1 Tax=Bonamia ostreae TaxID=126728 RepID=A0ABV2AT96_9EUKA
MIFWDIKTKKLKEEKTINLKQKANCVAVSLNELILGDDEQIQIFEIGKQKSEIEQIDEKMAKGNFDNIIEEKKIDKIEKYENFLRNNNFQNAFEESIEIGSPKLLKKLFLKYKIGQNLPKSPNLTKNGLKNLIKMICEWTTSHRTQNLAQILLNWALITFSEKDFISVTNEKQLSVLAFFSNKKFANAKNLLTDSRFFGVFDVYE